MKPGNYQRSKQRRQDLCWKVHDPAQTFVLRSYTMHELRNQHVFIVILLCFVHRQGQKREQKHTTKTFVKFRNHSPPLTMVSHKWLDTLWWNNKISNRNNSPSPKQKQWLHFNETEIELYTSLWEMLHFLSPWFNPLQTIAIFWASFRFMVRYLSCFLTEWLLHQRVFLLDLY